MSLSNNICYTYISCYRQLLTKAAMKALFSDYPKKFKASTQHAESHYILQEGLFAIHGEVPLACKGAIVATIEEGKTIICKGNPDELPASINRNVFTPVYALETNGPLAVPTGLILIRYADNVIAASQKNAIQRIGYIIDQELPYAPQALWLKSANNDTAFAINNVSRLEALTDVANVEVQVLMKSARRG